MSRKKNRMKPVSRRKFLHKSLVAGMSSAVATTSYSQPVQVAAGDRIRVGFIGTGNRGSNLLGSFLKNSDVEVAALCDVYQPYLERDRTQVDQKLVKALADKIPEMDEKLPESVKRFKDFRHLLDDPEIDAVVIATPDHWHAVQTIMACQSGKDVYVEKPLTATILEGRRMVEAARRYDRVVQVGLQRRSSRLYQQVATLVQEGEIGKVTTARAYVINNMYPDGIGRASASDPPPGLDWDLWLGPRAWRPYQENIAPYKFRWWEQYSSQVGNWGVHYFDALRWILEEEAPVSVSAHGGRFAVEDDRTVPDTMEIIFEFASGRLLVFGQYEASGGAALEFGEVELRGTRANLYVEAPYSSSAGYRIRPSEAGQFQERAPAMDPRMEETGRENATDAHVRDFLDCVKSRRKCRCDLETGHRSTTFAHLANIALATRSRLEWDAGEERITHPAEANELLHYPYREPWELS